MRCEPLCAPLCARICLLICLATLVVPTGPATPAPTPTPTPPPTPKSEPNNTPKRRLRAARLAAGERLTLDGRGDEAAWARAEESWGFVERTPTPNGAPPVQSAVRALFDEEALYVLVRMETRPNEPPVAWELRRDRTELWSDDAISLKIDPRLDQRTSVVFVTNPAGAQLDFISLDNGQVFSVEHDAVWEVATHTTEGSWSAEYRLPYAALGLSAEAVRAGAIGLNLSRDHNGRQATDDWSLLAPEFGPFSALHYGRLEGLEGLKVGRPLTLMPYALGSGDSAGLGARAGFEARLALSEAEWVEATALTDFAQVDLDDPLVNLNRFPLYFPERRPFFIQGLDVFSFGRPGRAQLFFSRRVGLNDAGEEVPLFGGLKLYGRRGEVRYGALTSLTGADAEAPSRLWSVARARYDLGQGGYIGAIVVDREEVSLAGDELHEAGHYGAGLDARARLLDARLDLSGFYGLTLNPTLVGGAGGLEASWRDRNLRPSARLDWVSADFDPKMGFTDRRDLAQASAALTGLLYTPTPSLRLLSATLDAQRTLSADLTRDLGEGANASASACLSGNWCLAAGGGLLRDVVETPFTLGASEISAGRYESASAQVGVTAPAGRRFGGDAQVSRSWGYLGGDLLSLDLNARVALSPHLRLLVGGRAARFRRAGLEEPLLGASGQVIVTPSPTLQLDAVAQLNSATDSARAQGRLRWRYWPGSDAFLVVRRDVPLRVGGAEEWRVVLKVAWRFDTPF